MFPHVCMSRLNTHLNQQITAMAGPYIMYDNNTVVDRESGLMWAGTDNGLDIDWNDSRTFCRSYSVGGFTNWRMPSIEELQTLYTPKVINPSPSHPDCDGFFHINHLFTLSCENIWAADTHWQSVSFFNFSHGVTMKGFKNEEELSRVLPVRSISPEPLFFRTTN